MEPKNEYYHLMFHQMRQAELERAARRAGLLAGRRSALRRPLLPRFTAFIQRWRSVRRAVAQPQASFDVCKPVLTDTRQAPTGT